MIMRRMVVMILLKIGHVEMNLNILKREIEANLSLVDNFSLGRCTRWVLN
jgi:hypothetical protein